MLNIRAAPTTRLSSALRTLTMVSISSSAMLGSNHPNNTRYMSHSSSAHLNLHQQHSWNRARRWPSGCRIESRRLGPCSRALLLLLLLWRRRLLLRTFWLSDNAFYA